MKDISTNQKAQELLQLLEKDYRTDPDLLVFNLAPMTGGKRNRLLRAELMQLITGETLPASQCQVKHLEAQLLKKFNQLTLF